MNAEEMKQMLDEFHKQVFLKTLFFNKREITYYILGEGENAFISFHEFACTAEIMYKDIMKYSRFLKAIAINILQIENLEELNQIVNKILIKEKWGLLS